MTIEAIPVSQIEQGSPYLATGNGTAFPLDAQELQRAFEAVAAQDVQDAQESDELIGTGEAARILGVSPKTVDRILDSGQIPFIRYSPKGRRKVMRSEVLAYRDRSKRHSHAMLDNMREAISKGHLDQADLTAYRDGSISSCLSEPGALNAARIAFKGAAQEAELSSAEDVVQLVKTVRSERMCK
ncbi:hypothetical protein KIM372_16800 [Bombiscardovia nodaiensis]|uniref:Helix-turn-helix domain-containing protein n=1 Tax=Bombiscardovia nodaiensis TaxID=2932181 RepID=A0ABN6SE43_9BIFI|nr:hypothetical protein KIM372_16800 [Bombiscardovia nodaiensis]